MSGGKLHGASAMYLAIMQLINHPAKPLLPCPLAAKWHTGAVSASLPQPDVNGQGTAGVCVVGAR